MELKELEKGNDMGILEEVLILNGIESTCVTALQCFRLTALLILNGIERAETQFLLTHDSGELILNGIERLLLLLDLLLLLSSC